MLFDDVFYPGNPQRRRDVSVLQGQIRADFMSFQIAWNDCVSILNPLLAVNHPDLQLMTLTCSVDIDCVSDCVNIFNSAIVDAKPKFAKLLADIGLSNGVPGLPPDSINMDPEALHKLNNFITGVVDGSVAIFATWYVYSSIRVFTLVLNYAGVAVSETASVLAGALGGMVMGAIGFVISDVITSAIAGAVERKQLNEAIDALVAFRDRVADPLLKASVRLSGVAQNMRDNTYKLSPTMSIENGTVVLQNASTTVQSAQFPNVFLRIDGSKVTQPSSAGSGIVNCQFGARSWEQFLLIANADNTVSLESSHWNNVYLRMDGNGVTEPTGPGGGLVNCQFTAGAYEKFRLHRQTDGTYAIESVQWPGVYLRMDGTHVNESHDWGGGLVNCQFTAGPLEKFLLAGA
jgi:hypothetical protein